MKASSLAWVRLNSVPVIRAARPTVTRKFIAAMLEHPGKLKSLDDLDQAQVTELNARLAKTSNDTLEQMFLEHLKGSR